MGKTKTTRRRIPKQARSKKRYDAILDAAAALFADEGFDATTMDAIAERAGTSIGSVYQFFPNKEGLFEAMAERMLDREGALLEGLKSAPLEEVPWEPMLDGAIDGLVALAEADAGYRALLRNPHLYGRIAGSADALSDAFIDATERVIAHHAPALSKDRRRVVATALIELVGGMLFGAQRHGAAMARALLEETKRIARAYLTAELEG